MPEANGIEIIRCEKCGKPVFWGDIFWLPVPALGWVDMFCSPSCKKQYIIMIKELGSLFS